MPNPEELSKIMGNLDQLRIDLDGVFSFKCYGCGKCCKNRDDILLNAKDLFQLAKHMDLSPDQVVERYCEVYIGSQSGIPIVRLKPIGKNQVCPLLKDNRCSVHAAKPTVCALYPVGRYLKASKIDPSAPPETGYFVLPVTCGGHKKITVRSYLESFGIPTEDRFHTMWNETVMLLSTFCNEAICRAVPEKRMISLWGGIYQLLYLAYFKEMEFQPRFEQNISTLQKMLQWLRQDDFAQLLKSE
jgi:Fe-S-cluster containining protein